MAGMIAAAGCSCSRTYRRLRHVTHTKIVVRIEDLRLWAGPPPEATIVKLKLGCKANVTYEHLPYKGNCTRRVCEMAAPQEDKVMHAVHFDPDFSDDERREKLYAGDIVILSPTAGT